MKSFQKLTQMKGNKKNIISQMLLATCGSQLQTWMMQRDYFCHGGKFHPLVLHGCPLHHIPGEESDAGGAPGYPAKALLFICFTLLSATTFQCREDCTYLWSSILHLDTHVYGEIIIKLGNMVARKPTNRNTQI